MSETGGLIIPNEKSEISKESITKSEFDKENKTVELEREDIESTTKLVRNLGATNLLHEGQKLLLPVEDQKSMEVTDELKIIESQKPSDTSEPMNDGQDPLKSEKNTPRATPRDTEKIPENAEHQNTELTTKENSQKEVTHDPADTEDKDMHSQKSEDHESDPKKGEIFSITGQRGVKVSRHRDQVTVFPSGCMGIPEDTVDEAATNKGRRFLRASDVQERDSGHLEGCPRRRPPSASVRQAHQVRNPLTGEGYVEADFICGHGKHLQPIGKHDQNRESVVDTKGKSSEKIAEISMVESKEGKPKRIPPGGYSTPLW